MKKLIVILSLLILSACAHNSGAIISDKKIFIDSAALQPCSLLKEVPISLPEEALMELIELYSMYAVCSKKQDDSITIIKKLANIGE